MGSKIFSLFFSIAKFHWAERLDGQKTMEGQRGFFQLPSWFWERDSFCCWGDSNDFGATLGNV